MSFGVTDTGFIIKTLQDLLDEIEESQRSAFGSTINTQADSVLGQLNGIYADQLAELWEAAQAIYRARQPDSASGEALDNVAAITGAIRLPATSSYVAVSLNLNNGVTVSAGKQISIGANGEIWEVRDGVSNTSGENATVEAIVDAVNAGPITGNPNTIDTIKTPVSGWLAKAAITSEGTEPFHLVDGQTLFIEVDEGTAQTVTFNTGDFADITNATAQEVSDAIDADITGASSVPTTSKAIRITSDLDGSGSSLRVTGGTGFAGVGFSKALFKGFNNNAPATQINGNSEPYSLSDGQTLTLTIDGGGTQTITFNTGDFVAIGAATAREVADVLVTQLTNAVAYVVGDKVQIETNNTGVNAAIEITGGTGNPALNFPEEETIGTSGQATAGTNEETDAELRLRREQLLRISGAATTEAIRSALLNISGVTQAFVFENPTDTTDGNGLPPHSFESVVSGGTDDDVAQAIFDTKPIGIQTHRDPGASGRTVVLTDSQGESVTINFSRPDEIRMYIEVDITVDGDEFGGGDQVSGETQVKDALRTIGNDLAIGADVIILRFASAALGVAGVIDVTATKIEDTSPPTNTSNIVIASRELATFSTADMVINVTVA